MSILFEHWQNSVPFEDFFERYKSFDKNTKAAFSAELLDLVQQARCDMNDIGSAVLRAKIKPTSTCCVIARKGLYYHNLKRLFCLREEKITLLFLFSLIEIGIKRRQENDADPTKWWNRRIGVCSNREKWVQTIAK